MAKYRATGDGVARGTGNGALRAVDSSWSRIAGVATTSAVGSMVAGLVIALAGVAATGSVGNASASVTVALGGVSASATVGSAGVAQQAALNGVAAVGNVGDVVALSPHVSAAIAGVEAAADIGSLVASNSSSAMLAGVSAVASAGDVGFTEPGNVALSGVDAAGLAGSVGPQASLGITLPGAFGSVGSLRPAYVQALLGDAEPMTRPVLLLTLGADPLPDTTPVIPVPATWVPAIYVPPAVPAPTGVLASAIADAVLLTWSAVSALAPEYEIERAPDVAGVPGAWLALAKTMDLRYIAAAPDGLAYWFRLRTESLGRLSDYTTPIVGVPIASNPVVVPLTIVAGVVTINCAYQQFKLVLNANVTSVVFVNVPAATTILIEIEQASPGAHTIAWPAAVTPLSGVAYVVTATVGAIDMVGLTTNNAGVTWRLTAQQPVQATGGTGGAPVVTIAPSPASATVATDGTTAAAPSVLVTATASGGTAPITHAWTRADATGGTNFLIDNAAIAAPTFSIAAAVTAYNAMQQWRDTVTDAAALTAQAIVEITLTRTAPVAPSVTLAPSPASAVKVTPYGTTSTVSKTVTATRAGMVGPFTQAWAQLSGDAGISAVYTASGDTCAFQASANKSTIWSGVFRHTTTDTGNGNATDTADVTVNLEIMDDR